MENIFIWAQVVGFIAIFANMVVWQLKNTKNIVIMHVPLNMLWAFQFFLLGGFSGVITNLVGIVKDVAIYFGGAKWGKIIIPLYLLCLWGAAYIWTTEMIGLLPFIGVTLYNICLLYPENRALIARGTVLCQLVWISYDIYVMSYFGVLACILIAVSAIIGMARHEQWELGKCYKSFVVSVVRSLFMPAYLKAYS